MFSTISLAALAITAVIPFTSAELGYGGLPLCARKAALSDFPAHCDLYDFNCICNKPLFIQALPKLFRADCTEDQTERALLYTKELCLIDAHVEIDFLLAPHLTLTVTASPTATITVDATITVTNFAATTFSGALPSALPSSFFTETGAATTIATVAAASTTAVGVAGTTSAAASGTSSSPASISSAAAVDTGVGRVEGALVAAIMGLVALL